MRKLKKSLLILLSAMMLMSTSLTVFAYDNNDVAKVQSYIDENGMSMSISKYAKEVNSSNQSEAAGKAQVTSGGKTYYFEEDGLEKAVKAVNKSAESSKAIDDLDEGVNGMVKPDTETGMTILSGFAGIVNTFIGIMIVLITLFMTVFTALDICYIVFPAIRSWLDNSYESGGANSKKNADGSTSMRFVTDEAQYAVKQFDMGNNGQGGGGNPMTTYFKKRVLSYIVLAIMLFILLTGNITLITNLAIKVVSGILEVLTSI